MKKLKLLERFTKINKTQTYFVVKEDEDRYGGGDQSAFYGTGEQVIEELKSSFNYDHWKEDQKESGEAINLKAFLEWVWYVNGDGYDYFMIYNHRKS